MIERQPFRWLKIMTDAHRVVDWHPPSLDDLGDLREGD